MPDALLDAGTGATDPRNPGVGTPGETWKSVEGKKIPGVVLESSGVVLEVPKSGVRPLETTVQQNFWREPCRAKETMSFAWLWGSYDIGSLHNATLRRWDSRTLLKGIYWSHCLSRHLNLNSNTLEDHQHRQQQCLSLPKKDALNFNNKFCILLSSSLDTFFDLFDLFYISAQNLPRWVQCTLPARWPFRRLKTLLPSLKRRVAAAQSSTFSLKPVQSQVNARSSFECT